MGAGSRASGCRGIARWQSIRRQLLIPDRLRLRIAVPPHAGFADQTQAASLAGHMAGYLKSARLVKHTGSTGPQRVLCYRATVPSMEVEGLILGAAHPQQVGIRFKGSRGLGVSGHRDAGLRNLRFWGFRV